MEYEPTDENNEFGFGRCEIGEVYGTDIVTTGSNSNYEELNYSSHQKKSYGSTSISLIDKVKYEKMNINMELIKLITVGTSTYGSKIYSKIARLYVTKRQFPHISDYYKNIEITKIVKPVDCPVYEVKITDLCVSIYVKDIMRFLQYSLNSITDEQQRIIKKIITCPDHVDKDDIFGLYTNRTFINFKKEKPSLKKLASQVICFENIWVSNKNNEQVDKILYNIKQCGLGLLKFCMYDYFEIQAEYETIHFDKPMTMLECLKLESEIIEKYDVLERKHYEQFYNSCMHLINIINKNIKTSDLDTVSCVLENVSIFNFGYIVPKLISDFSVDTFHNVAFMSWEIGNSMIIMEYYESLMSNYVYWKTHKKIKRINRFDRKIKSNEIPCYRRNYSPEWYSETINQKKKDKKQLIKREIDECYGF